MEQDWLKHFKENNINQGRPEGMGWFSTMEMAAQAGIDVQVIRRYLARHEKDYESKIGTTDYGLTRTTRYYRLKVPALRHTSKKRNRSSYT